jgi:hypothetical protein
VSARLPRRIKGLFSRLNKTLLLSVVVLIAGSFFIAKVTFAQSTTSNNYTTYTNLFDGSGSGIQAAAGSDLLQDTATQNIDGFSINVTLAFNNTTTDNSQNDYYENKWNHVQDDQGVTIGPYENDTFLVRVCDSLDATNCWLNTIPYDNSGNLSEQSTGEVLITPFNKGGGETFTSNDWRNPIQLTNFPILKQTTFTQTSTDAGDSEQNGVQYIYTRNTANGKDEGTVSPLSSAGVKFPTPSSAQITLWYCAARDSGNSGEPDGSQAYQTVGSNNDTIATFGTLCNRASYFLIGQPITISIPSTAQAAAAQVNTQQTTSTGGSSNNLPECGFGTLTGGGTINGCVAHVAYGVYYLAAWIAGLFGELFDFFIGYSLSDASYRYPFAVTGWKLVRDISNVFFIIILIWTGFSAVFGISKFSMKSVVPNLIVNALLINFSLFATRLVIDVSNVTARVFYSQMVTCQAVNKNPDGTCNPANAERVGGYWALSEAIVGAFNPQQIFQASILQPSAVTATHSGKGGSQFNAQNVGSIDASKLSAVDYANYFTVICLVAAAIMVFVAIMFFKVAFLFMGRVAGLYICMIFSPFAFLTREMPMFGNIQKLTWKSWASELTSYALLAPVFVFFLYIIYVLVTSNFAKQIGTTVLNSSNASAFQIIMSIAIPMAIIYFLIEAARKQAENLSGDIGKSVQEWGEKITGFATGAAVGIATGGAAFAGRNIAGRAMKKYGEGGKDEQGNTRAMRWAMNAPNSRYARWRSNLQSKSQTGSWDVRNVGLGGDRTVGGTLNKGLQTYLGKNLSYAGSDFIGLSKDQGKGGIIAIDKKRTEKRQKKNDEKINFDHFDHLSKDEAKTVWENYKKQSIEKKAEAAGKAEGNANWEKHIEKEAPVAAEVAAIKTLQDEETNLKTEQTRLKEEGAALEEQKKAGNFTTEREAAAVNYKIFENKAKQVDVETKLTDTQTKLTAKNNSLQTLKDDTVANIKKNKSEKNSAAYAEAAKEGAEKGRKDAIKEFDAYGDIKDGKGLTVAMRSEYAKDLMNNSFWRKDGKPRNYLQTAFGSLGGVMGGGAAGTAGLLATGSMVASSILGALGIIGTPVAGAVIGHNTTTDFVSGFADMVGGIHNKAAQASINAAIKTGGKGSELGKLEEKIKIYDNQILAEAERHVKDVQGMAVKFKAIDDMNEEQINTTINGAIATAKVQKRKLQENKVFANEADEVKNEMQIAALESKIYDFQKIKKNREDVMEKMGKITK